MDQRTRGKWLIHDTKRRKMKLKSKFDMKRNKTLIHQNTISWLLKASIRCITIPLMFRPKQIYLSYRVCQPVAVYKPQP